MSNQITFFVENRLLTSINIQDSIFDQMSTILPVFSIIDLAVDDMMDPLNDTWHVVRPNIKFLRNKYLIIHHHLLLLILVHMMQIMNLVLIEYNLKMKNLMELLTLFLNQVL